MKKLLSFIVSTGFCMSAFAGLVDHEDCIDFPNVNVDAHLLKIAHHYYPDALPSLPQGISRSAAWKKDIRSAAEGLDIPGEKLQTFIDFVLDPCHHDVQSAPHKKLLEFELYARGKRALFYSKGTDVEKISAWTELLALPIEQRRAATIPVLYCMNHYASLKEEYDSEHFLLQIAEARKKGCMDTQGLERALTANVPDLETIQSADIAEKIKFYNSLMREFAMNWTAEKKWRYINFMDCWCHSEGRGDNFYSGDVMPRLRFTIYVENDEALRELCKCMPSLRDFVVALGLTNRDMRSAKEIAKEFADQSPLNAPILALRLPLNEAEKLLSGKPEHAQLLAQLKLKELTGMKKIKAIDDYISKYPDYTPEDMPVTSIALLTHAELYAFKGLEYYKMRKYQEALKCWLKGGTAEDMALIAEQIFTTDELLDFCRKYIPDGTAEDWDNSSCQCARNDKVLYPNLAMGDIAGYAIRNILARRLMREKRFQEARPWFTGMKQRYYSELYFRLSEKLNDPSNDRETKLETCLSLASLIRTKGDILFGTFLEPDNVVCHGEYPCEWGTRCKSAKLRKPDLPRFHYRWIAADYYRSAADFTDDSKIKGFCFWMAGTILKNRDVKKADADYKKLAVIRPDLVEKNWFKKLKDAPEDIQQWEQQFIFIFGADRVAAWKPELPVVDKVKLPENDGSVNSLLNLGMKLYDRKKFHDSLLYRQALYAFYLAGQKGSVEGYTLCGALCIAHFPRYEYGIAFLKKALEMSPDSLQIKYLLGHAYIKVGLWQEGTAIIKMLADMPEHNDDKKVKETAAYDMSIMYREGLYGIKKDEGKAVFYRKKAGETKISRMMPYSEYEE